MEEYELDRARYDGGFYPAVRAVRSCWEVAGRGTSRLREKQTVTAYCTSCFGEGGGGRYIDVKLEAIRAQRAGVDHTCEKDYNLRRQCSLSGIGQGKLRIFDGFGQSRSFVALMEGIFADPKPVRKEKCQLVGYHRKSYCFSFTESRQSHCVQLDFSSRRPRRIYSTYSNARVHNTK